MKWACVLVSLGVFLASSTDGLAGGVKAGYVTSGVHPGDPLKEIHVVGFETVKEALRFVDGGFEKGDLTPKVDAVLSRGQDVGFAGAHFLVFFHVWESKPELLSIARCHADLHLVVGSCGFQLTLSVQLVAPAEAPPEESPPKERAPR